MFHPKESKLFLEGKPTSKTKKRCFCNSIIVFGGDMNLKKEVSSVILSSFLAGKQTPKPKKEVRSVILA